jgi:MFS family permease
MSKAATAARTISREADPQPTTYPAAHARGSLGRLGAAHAVLLVFLPFAAGYYLSYLYRTINALIATQLSASIELGASELGLLTSIYFLAFAAVQLPVGVGLDRYGPRRVQGLLLLIAAVGAAVFASAHSLPALIVGRALIGLGVAGALIAGLKALVQWFPKDRLPFFNGCFVMVGALGAVTATTPAEMLIAWIGWRALFGLLAAATAASALAIIFLSPEPARIAPLGARPGVAGLKAVYSDTRFWRLAPLSTMCISTAWSLQGLWAAPWLVDVEHLERPAIVRHLLVMALALCAGAFLLGFIAERLRRSGIRTQTVLAVVAVVFITAQVALLLRAPLSSYLLWAIVASVGAATVLSYSILAEYFASDMAGQANAALNMFHIGGAFVLQYVIGVIIGMWSSTGGHYPFAAYETAFATLVCLQVAALIWFTASELLGGKPAGITGLPRLVAQRVFAPVIAGLPPQTTRSTNDLTTAALRTAADGSVRHHNR